MQVLEMGLRQPGEDKKAGDARQEIHLISNSIFALPKPRTSNINLLQSISASPHLNSKNGPLRPDRHDQAPGQASIHRLPWLHRHGQASGQASRQASVHRLPWLHRHVNSLRMRDTGGALRRHNSHSSLQSFFE
ncbi:hypothetical protein M441DRAFT_329751 [Trichoderma asperellum CBS 433.97]|uniref:Uncharacterized protein n=1 Tax=Trichoderma asperellum (strain ATCC 204424 / CBS 433.97 / NBRC 101777) TaxID=1042311 RepID=A0A2T3YSN8_TRIA4|nr:hypothetical protein M441DRAFT_329751 [Trichoderma asperellum CBS 433.97]PTB35526.1 hypothetical protein M441DRAFT_329751 [Trichoderma asperellum CBS 433.97]